MRRSEAAYPRFDALLLLNRLAHSGAPFASRARPPSVPGQQISRSLVSEPNGHGVSKDLTCMRERSAACRQQLVEDDPPSERLLLSMRRCRGRRRDRGDALSPPLDGELSCTSQMSPVIAANDGGTGSCRTTQSGAPLP